MRIRTPFNGLLSVSSIEFLSMYIFNDVQKEKQRRAALIFICVPVSPGNSRLIWAFPRNFGIWIDKIVPRWIFHIGQNLILDSDLYLLHVEVILISFSKTITRSSGWLLANFGS